MGLGGSITPNVHVLFRDSTFPISAFTRTYEFKLINKPLFRPAVLPCITQIVLYCVVCNSFGLGW
jgi:hypothetical protein